MVLADSTAVEAVDMPALLARLSVVLEDTSGKMDGLLVGCGLPVLKPAVIYRLLTAIFCPELMVISRRYPRKETYYCYS